MAERVTDVRGVVFEPFEPPVRVVSLVPSITELLFDLGLEPGEEIVGRTRFCVRPPGRVEQVPAVGGTKTVETGQVLGLDPDLVVANRDENPREIVGELERTPDGPGVFVTDPASFDEAVRMIRELGRLVGRTRQGASMAEQVEVLRSELPDRDRGTALYLIWTEPYMSVSPETFVHDMLRLAGYENVIGPSFLHVHDYRAPGAARYPEVTVKEIMALRPDHILLASEPFPFEEKHAQRLRLRLAEQDPDYAEEVEVRLVDGECYSWYGSRLLEALRTFRRELKSV
ncbi:MAG: helical backbone metal receptor [bacterium]